MTTQESEVPLIEGKSNGSSPPLELNDRKSRISLWCILFWIVALAGLTATSLALDGETNETNDDVKTVERLYVAGDCLIIAGIIMTIIHLYFITENEIFKLIGGILFIVGGILHIAGTSKFVDYYCVYDYYYGKRSWCRAQFFGQDFMMEYLAIFIGIDIITFHFDARILRIIAYCCILSVCCLLICSYLNHQANINSYYDTHSNKTTQSAYFITGIVSGILFIVFLIIQIGNKSLHYHPTTIARYACLFLGFVLINGAGLIFYTLFPIYPLFYRFFFPGYQTLLVISTAVIIAYELQYI